MQATEEFDEITVYGARGHSVSLLALFEERWQGRVSIRALIDDLDYGFTHPVLGVPVISGAERQERFGAVPVLVTPGKPDLRARLFARLTDEGATLATATFPRLGGVAGDVVIGPGTQVSPHLRLSANVRIGEGGQILGVVIGHDVTIGPYCNVGFNAVLGGHIEVGAGVDIATSAILRSGTRARPLRIGDGAHIGVGAVVLRDVPAGERVLGNPAMTVPEWRRLRRLIKGPGRADG